MAKIQIEESFSETKKQSEINQVGKHQMVLKSSGKTKKKVLQTQSCTNSKWDKHYVGQTQSVVQESSWRGTNIEWDKNGLRQTPSRTNQSGTNTK